MCVLDYTGDLQKLVDYSLFDSIYQHEATNTDINVHIKRNDISNIALNMSKDISNTYFSSISIIDKNSESGYYLVNWTKYS